MIREDVGRLSKFVVTGSALAAMGVVLSKGVVKAGLFSSGIMDATHRLVDDSCWKKREIEAYKEALLNHSQHGSLAGQL